MGLARILFCLVLGYGMVSHASPSWAADAESALERAEAKIAHAAHTDADTEPSGSDPLSVDPDLAIWTLVVFVVLLFVLKKFAWGPILQALEGRETSIANHIADAERMNQEAKALLAQYEEKLAAAASQVREMMEEARRDAEHTRQTILAEAKSGADAERARSLRDIESATDAALETLAERSAQLAVELAGKILKFKLSSDDHARLIQEALAKFPAAASSAN
jgi:F-type H+-transporting ATPase subunit b